MADFFPEHWEDLQKSGLSDEIIAQMAVRSISRDGVKGHLGFTLAGIGSLSRLNEVKVRLPDSKESEGCEL